MKTAAKVFIILGMIFGFWYILPLIFGGIALGQMKTQKPSTGVSVCVLLFCSLLGGIFLLCSDGLSNVIPDDVLYHEIIHNESPEECARKLLAITMENGAPDNVTIVLAQL